jgi:aminoglycoside 2'-N-acetyltransferase I
MLTGNETAGLRRLFDSQYLADYGFWDPDRPYGYSPADVHVIGFERSEMVAHVGFQVRGISVGAANIVVAGTGGVLVDAAHRSTGLGSRMMATAETAMRNDSRILFGFLGCREEVVPFYEATGWHRIHTVERSTDRTNHTNTVTSTDSPILIYPVHAHVNEWPQGQINLLGTQW